MGVAASKLPEQESSRRYIPPEIVEEILLNLPVKSLLRFSTVSKSWNSMISDGGFIRKHRSRAALPGRERVLISHSLCGSLTPASTFPLSSISSNQVVDDSTPLIFPFEIENFSLWSAGIPLLASCGELWCVEHKWSLFLWNPSMRTYKKLPHPTIMDPYNDLHEFYFGIGYDSLGDDYKILKVSRTTSLEYDELYSLRSDSWKKIRPFPKKALYQNWKCMFASGALYWVASADDASHGSVIVASFDLSTEKYAEVAQPPCDPVFIFDEDRVKLTVIRGKLCLHVNYGIIGKYVLWVMQECEGGNNSWIKMVDIDYCRVDPYTRWSLEEGELVGINSLTALYFYDNGKILIKAKDEEYPTIFMYIDGKSIPQNVYRCYYDEYTSGHLFVESLVSPATYCSRPRPPETQPTAVAVGCKQPRNRIRASFAWFWAFILHYVSISCSIIEIIFKWKDKLVCYFN